MYVHIIDVQCAVGSELRVRGGGGVVRKAAGFQATLVCLQAGLPHAPLALTLHSAYSLCVYTHTHTHAYTHTHAHTLFDIKIAAIFFLNTFFLNLNIQQLLNN